MYIYSVENDGTVNIVRKSGAEVIKTKAPKRNKNICKLCGGVVTPSRLRKHLIVQHGFNKAKASKVMGVK